MESIEVIYVVGHLSLSVSIVLFQLGHFQYLIPILHRKIYRKNYPGVSRDLKVI